MQKSWVYQLVVFWLPTQAAADTEAKHKPGKTKLSVREGRRCCRFSDVVLKYGDRESISFSQTRRVGDTAGAKENVVVGESS